LLLVIVWPSRVPTAEQEAAGLNRSAAFCCRSGQPWPTAIAAKLNERNVRTARGGKWTHVQVGAILHPFVAGAAA
jgi:hypothetical protein